MTIPEVLLAAFVALLASGLITRFTSLRHLREREALDRAVMEHHLAEVRKNLGADIAAAIGPEAEAAATYTRKDRLN